MKGIALTVLLSAAIGLAGGTAATAQEVVEQPGPFAVSIGGETVNLDGLVVRKAAASGRLPIILFTNGGPTTATAGMAVSAGGYVRTLRDFARRGWLAAVVVRRGFGTSEGPKPVPVECQAASYSQWANRAADDLQATMALLAARPDADPTRIVVVGSSNAGAAVVALSARNPPGLVGVISISGGLQAESGCAMRDVLVSAFRETGARSHASHLWMYSNTDKAFGPDLSDQLHAAFLDAGGDVKFVLFNDPHNGDVGNGIFGGAPRAWYMEADAFFRANGWPTWTLADVINLEHRLAITDGLEKEQFEGTIGYFLSAPGEKALAFSKTSQAAWARPVNAVGAIPEVPMWMWIGTATLDAARQGALGACQKVSQQCTIQMENLSLVGGPP